MENDSRPSTLAAEESTMFFDVLRDTPLVGRRKPISVIGCILYSSVLAGYIILVVGAPWFFRRIDKYIPSLLCSSHVALLAMTGIFQQHLLHQIQRIRLQGYYALSQKLWNMACIPHACITYATGVVLLVLVWRPHTGGSFSYTVIIRIIMLIEVTCAGCCLTVYTCMVRHQLKNPDVLRCLYSPLEHEGLRHYDGGGMSDRQMAVFQYQQETIHFLNEEVVRLQEWLEKVERGGTRASEVEATHVLAVRDQELRAMCAEVDKLQSDLRHARSLVLQGHSEIQRLHTQYVGENERLRGILTEWSARAAKLERALEAERISRGHPEK